MTDSRARTQDIRPLKILVLNLMPKKTETETQLSRLLGNSPLQVEFELIHTKSHIPKHTPKEYLLAFYKTFDDIIKNQSFKDWCDDCKTRLKQIRLNHDEDAALFEEAKSHLKGYDYERRIFEEMYGQEK